MQIRSLINSIHSIKKNMNTPSIDRSLCTTPKTDIFTKTTNPLDSIPTIEIDGNVDENYSKKIASIIKSCPSKWLNLFKQNNYKVIITDDLKRTVKKSNPELAEIVRPTSLGLTYTDPKTNQNLFYFSSNINPDFLGNVVYHEFGHGICNIKKLYASPEIKSQLSKDIKSIINERKLDRLTSEERELLSNYFFNKKANMPVDEIIADLFAQSQCGNGCYGSELMLSKENPKLMPYLFPNLYESVKSL